MFVLKWMLCAVCTLAAVAALSAAGRPNKDKPIPDVPGRALTHDAALRLPVVACPTGETPDLTGRRLAPGADWIWVHPMNLPKSVAAPTGLPARVAAHLARYEGDVHHARDMNVLAPRGWKCFAYIPEDGNWEMTVVPAEAKPKQRMQVTFYWAAAGFAVACHYFKSARAEAPNPALCHVPAHTAVTQRTSRLVTTVTAPAGSWTPYAARSFLYWHPKGPPGAFARGAGCVLPASERSLCDAILADAQPRQGEEPSK
jgi:hypothetical protein